MIKVSVYNKEGNKTEDLNLSEEVFGLVQNNDLVHQAYVAIASNKRQVLAHAKDRGERKGSGKKPWRQKGTGNARVGSVRNPLWKKGGVTFGPTKDRNFSKDINKKMKQQATAIALSGKVKNNTLIVLDEINIATKKTKEFAKILSNLKFKGSVLIGLSEKEREFKQFCRNIENAGNISTRNMNVFDILNHKNLLLSKESVKYLEDKYKKTK